MMKNSFEQHIINYLDNQKDTLIYQACRYALEGGKRFRPRVIFAILKGMGIDESTGYDDYTNVGDTPTIDVDQTADINVPDGWFIEIHEPAVIELVAK